MGNWNYRVFKEKTEYGWDYCIRTAYFHSPEDLESYSWSIVSAHPSGEDLNSLKEDFEMMQLAFTKPVLIVEGDKIIGEENGVG